MLAVRLPVIRCLCLGRGLGVFVRLHPGTSRSRRERWRGSRRPLRGGCRRRWLSGLRGAAVDGQPFRDFVRYEFKEGLSRLACVSVGLFQIAAQFGEHPAQDVMAGI